MIEHSTFQLPCPKLMFGIVDSFCSNKTLIILNGANYFLYPAMLVHLACLDYNILVAKLLVNPTLQVLLSFYSASNFSTSAAMLVKLATNHILKILIFLLLND